MLANGCMACCHEYVARKDFREDAYTGRNSVTVIRNLTPARPDGPIFGGGGRSDSLACFCRMIFLYVSFIFNG